MPTRHMHVTEVTTKSALVRSRIPAVEHVINPYTGCGHGCRYCCAVFMVFRQHGREAALSDDYARRTGDRLASLLGGKIQKV